MTALDPADGYRHPEQLAPICPDPVFIIGSPRSGTTVLARALAQHSELWASGESYLLAHIFRNGFVQHAYERSMQVPGPRWMRVQEVSEPELLAYVGAGLNALFTSRSEGRRWIDHTPHYAFVADTLAEAFPGARFIHLLRDGRDVARSMLSFAGSIPDPEVAKFVAENIAWADGFRAGAEAWSKHVGAAARFCDSHPDRSTTVRYEELVARPEEIFSEIQRFLGVEKKEAAPARFLGSRRINSSFEEPNRLSGPSLWDTWDDERKRTFVESAGATMIRCGYLTSEELQPWGETEAATRARH